MVKIENKRVVELNKNYMDFVLSCKNIEDKEIMKNKYNEIVGLRINNIERVGNRVLREELKGEVKKVLKEIGLSYDEYKKVDEKIRGKFKKENKYLSVEI